jgi:hypothetical protein
MWYDLFYRRVSDKHIAHKYYSVGDAFGFAAIDNDGMLQPVLVTSSLALSKFKKRGLLLKKKDVQLLTHYAYGKSGLHGVVCYHGVQDIQMLHYIVNTINQDRKNPTCLFSLADTVRGYL